MRSITDSGFFKTLDTATHIGDKGYIKPGIIAPPVKKPTHGEITGQGKNDTTSNRVRYLIKRVIASLTTWRVHPHRLPPSL